MYISKVKLKKYKITTSDFYQDHQNVWKLFHDSNKSRDFLFRKYHKKSDLHYLIVSKEKPIDPSNNWDIESKTYDPFFYKDQKLKFSTFFNPTYTKSRNKNKYSLISYARWKYKQETGYNPQGFEKEHVILSAMKNWFDEREENLGFRIVGLPKVTSYEIFYSVIKKTGFTGVDVDGILQIIDVEKFKETLITGIGRSRSFGCGLLLVKK